MVTFTSKDAIWQQGMCVVGAVSNWAVTPLRNDASENNGQLVKV